MLNVARGGGTNQRRADNKENTFELGKWGYFKDWPLSGLSVLLLVRALGAAISCS